MAGQPSGVAAFVEAFGNSYAQGYNRRVQAQLAQKNAQNAAIAETLVTSGAENPDLWQNQTFLKAANEVLGKDNAAAVAEAQIAHKQSGMGQLIDALRRIPTAAVSAGADGPGTGPSVPFNELNPVDQTNIARARLQGISPVEAGMAFGTGVGQLQEQTQKQAAGISAKDQSTIDLNAAKIAHMQENEKIQRERIAASGAGKAKATPEEQAAAAAAKKRAVQDITPVGTKAPLYVFPNGKNPTPDMTNGEAAKRGALVLTPDGAKIREGLTASVHLLDRMERGVKELYTSDSPIAAGANATKYAGELKFGTNATLQDLQDVNNIGLHLLRNVLNEKGNLRADVLAKGEKNLFGLYETKTSARSKLRFWKDVFAAGYQATGVPPPHHVRKFLTGASKSIGSLYEKGTAPLATKPWEGNSSSTSATPAAPAADVEAANLDAAFLQ